MRPLSAVTSLAEIFPSLRQFSTSLIKLSTTAPSAWSLTGAVSRHFPSCAAKLDPVVPVLDRNALELVAIEVDDVAGFAPRLGRVRLFAFEKLDPKTESRRRA